MKPLVILIFLSNFLMSFITSAQNRTAILGTKTYTGDRSDNIFNNAIQTSDGGFITTMATGSSPGTGSIDQFCSSMQGRVVFTKYNATGNLIEWVKCKEIRDEDTYYRYIQPIVNKGYVYAGKFTSSFDGMFIEGRDSNDQRLWFRAYSKGTIAARLVDFAAMSDGGFLLASTALYTDTNATIHYGGLNDDILLIRTDSVGNKLWSKVIGTSDFDLVIKILPTTEGGFYLVWNPGKGDYDGVPNHGWADYHVNKYNSSGNLIWHKYYGGSYIDAPKAACLTPKGNLLIAGYSKSNDIDVQGRCAECSLWLIEIDSAGNLLWQNSMGGQHFMPQPSSIAKASDGSIWICAQVNCYGVNAQVADSFGKDDVCFFHTDSVGNFLSSRVVGSKREDLPGFVWPLPNNTVIGTGRYYNNTGFFDKEPNTDMDIFWLVLAPWTTGIEEGGYEYGYDIKVYPNPTSGVLHIELPEELKAQKLRYILYSSDGKTVAKKEAKGNLTWSLPECSPGVYRLAVSNYESLLLTRNISIQ